MAKSRDIKYINKDFGALKQNLIDYSRTYFPTSYNDFSPSSPGMMFMEMAAYVGDVLSFYLDNQLQETFLQFSRQENNLFELAYMFSYKPRVTGVASTTMDFYQQIPAIDSGGGNYVPDYSYALFINQNASIKSTNNSAVSFLVQDNLNFASSGSMDPTEVTVYSVDGSGDPTFFLLKKSRKSISSTINTTTVSVGAPQSFFTTNINDSNIVEILDIIDSDGNEWYEVDTLGQETVFDTIRNSNAFDPNFTADSGDVPYLLRLKKVQRRFATKFIDSGSMQIQFGAGSTTDDDESIIPNPDNVGIGLPYERIKLTTAFSPTNFIFTNTYGIAPSNTTLTIRYLTGGGIKSNVSSNDLTTLTANIIFLNSSLDATTSQTIFNSVAVTNPIASSGGGDGDTINEIRQNTIAQFSTQQRTVTADDYLVRALSMPSNYGSISKAHITSVSLKDSPNAENTPILDLYTLTYDQNKKLSTPSLTLKQNLRTYLSQYRMIGDVVNIKEAFIVNIGVNFEIIVLPDYNSSEVILNCINSLIEYFNIDKWQINQPIILKELSVLLDRVEGVQTVDNVEIINKVGENIGYSRFGYDILGATSSKIIYPSLDPMIFEVKYPTTDISGKVVSF